MLRSRLAGVWTAWIAAMLCSFSCLAFRALLGLLVRSRRGPGVKDIEPMTLRHELDVVRHQISRRADRALLAAAACPRRAQPNHCCWSTPRTVLGWHRTPCPPHVAPRQQPARPTAALGGDRGTRAPAPRENRCRVIAGSRPARRNGAKSDELDAIRAAREALTPEHLAQPRQRG